MSGFSDHFQDQIEALIAAHEHILSKIPKARWRRFRPGLEIGIPDPILIVMRILR